MKEISLGTRSRVEMIDITAAIQKAIGEEKIEEGICLVYTKHILFIIMFPRHWHIAYH